MIQAIETVYNGYRFRSRLEARWAVFFDTLGIRYEYEKEGFELPSGRYLPDFWLPGLSVWVEIKPSREAADQDVLQLGVELAVHTGAFTYVLAGQPWAEAQAASPMFVDGEATAYCGVLCDPLGCDEPYYWCECSVCGEVGIQWEASSDRLRCGHGVHGPRALTTKLADAFLAARQARFEFGESGAPAVAVPGQTLGAFLAPWRMGQNVRVRAGQGQGRYGQVAGRARPGTVLVRFGLETLPIADGDLEAVASARPAPPRGAPAAGCWKLGDRLRHASFGEGIVVQSKPAGGDEEVIVAFSGHGVKRFLASLAGFERAPAGEAPRIARAQAIFNEREGQP